MGGDVFERVECLCGPVCVCVCRCVYAGVWSLFLRWNRYALWSGEGHLGPLAWVFTQCCVCISRVCGCEVAAGVGDEHCGLLCVWTSDSVKRVHLQWMGLWCVCLCASCCGYRDLHSGDRQGSVVDRLSYPGVGESVITLCGGCREVDVWTCSVVGEEGQVALRLGGLFPLFPQSLVQLGSWVARWRVCGFFSPSLLISSLTPSSLT